ncbi:hypothetical protein [Leptolyngbya sp. BC1307]|uniref:hypothetical protein n=1 Tax=Leptolyngbya sp. BC1307 TaxID=2029589 RepID=UPI00197DBD11|nr:hypothetical protein [Leptolyngbya sp. BC1307]
MIGWAIAATLSLKLPNGEAGNVLSPIPQAAVIDPQMERKPASEDGATGSEPDPPRPYMPLRPQTTCPAEVEPLTALLLRDIPNYTNRVLQRTVAALPGNEADGRAPYRPSYVLIAGRSELEPLDLNDYMYTTSPDAGGPITQIFFTTLSRQYSGLRDKQVQEYHWLFLTQADDGWRLALMFSAIDDVGNVRSPLPPRENSHGSVGQAVQLWLRDCRAGAIYPLE